MRPGFYLFGARSFHCSMIKIPKNVS